MFTNFTNEIVYSPQNPHLENLFGIVAQFVRPFLNINSVSNSSLLAPRLTQANSYVGVEFPDWYAVCIQKFVRLFKIKNILFSTESFFFTWRSHLLIKIPWRTSKNWRCNESALVQLANRFLVSLVSAWRGQELGKCSWWCAVWLLYWRWVDLSDSEKEKWVRFVLKASGVCS